MTEIKLKIKAVLFDIDGTLFDQHSAQRQIFKAFKREFASLFGDIDDYMLMTIYLEAARLAGEYFYTDNDKKLIHLYQFQMFLTMLGRDDGYEREMADFYIGQYLKTKAAIPDARMVVEQLSKRYQLGVISNGTSLVQQNKLKSLGIDQLLRCVIVSEDVDMLKPDPNIFRKAADNLRLETGKCLYVGNTYDHDIIGGSEAGMLTCWFNPSGTRPIIESVKPDYEIKTLDKLLDILR
jgi:HAD superfamily hydrolase (TIGR01549 family)